ncbi:hypothetical protein ATCC90586_009675 [Pythium insidiosum]|nr:hypothetical protein ATCC90586_009675 [Pythium insidiosum]
MDKYRATLMGRALADVLQEMESSQQLRPEESDLLFELFDATIQEELDAAAAPLPAGSNTGANVGADDTVSRPTVFTHERMDVEGHVRSYNRFMDKWSVHVALPSSEGLRLDGLPLALPSTATTEMLVTLHDPIHMLSSSFKNACRQVPQTATRSYAKAATAEIGNYFIDLSLATKIDKINNLLQNTSQ